MERGGRYALDDVDLLGFIASVFLGSYLVDVLTKRKYSLDKHEKTLNQNIAEADALRHAGQNSHQGGMF